MTQNGKVISVEGNIAKVLVVRRSACEGCKQKSLCIGVSDGCAESKPIETYAKNTAGASVGDEVQLTTPSTTVLWLAFCVFVLPIITAFAVYCVMSATAVSEGIMYGVTCAAFIVTAFVSCFILERKMKKNNRVEIEKILK